LQRDFLCRWWLEFNEAKGAYMSTQIVIIFLLTFIIHLITTLAYSVRIVGTRTGKIVIAFSLFNILALVARTANSFQAPLLAKFVEGQIVNNPSAGLTTDFRWILLVTSLATAAGIFLMPTFQRSFTKAVDAFNVYRSVPRLLVHGFSKSGIYHLRTSLTIPSAQNFGNWQEVKQIPWYLLVLNVIIEALLTVGVFAALYAGFLNPALRLTAISLAPIITGIATLLLFVIVDPYLSMLTDDVLAGKANHLFFRRNVVYLVGSRFVGTLFAQLLLVPAAYVILTIAEFL
jgi:hypothetical protein